MSGVASAATGTLVADNAYALFTGNATGSDMRYWGGGSDWGVAQTYTFNLNPGDYIYVGVTNWGGPRGFLGTFTTPIGVIATNTTDWVAKDSLNGIDLAGYYPPAEMFQSTGWSSTYSSNQYAWGTSVGNANAQWIWGANSDRILLRTASPVAAVPEPETYAMMLAGLGLLGVAARRRKQKAAT